MSEEQKYYKVVCEKLNCILHIRHFDLESERVLYSKLQEKLNNAKAPVSVDSYKKFILAEFLSDFSELSNTIPEDEEEAKDVIHAIYDSIVSLYVPFKLEIVCADLNNQLFFSNCDDSIKKIQQGFRDKLEDRLIAERPAPHTALGSLSDINNFKEFLGTRVIGQSEAVTSIVESLKLLISGLSDRASFFFIGPTGVGKTQIARLLGAAYSGNFYKINCAEYAGGHEYAKLIGSPPGYVGHSEKTLLGEKAEESNRWVFLFDEIEKAHPKFYDFLLSLLDEGTCTDNLGNTLDFSESIFIFTSNQGMGNVKFGKQLGFSGETDQLKIYESAKEEILESLKNNFSPEFLNRLDSTIMFNALEGDSIRKIVILELDKYPVEPSDELVDFIAESAYSVEYGARNIARFIKQNVATKIAAALLEHKVPKKPDGLYETKIVDKEVELIDLMSYAVKRKKKRTYKKKVPNASGT